MSNNLKTAALLLIFHTVLCKPAKDTDRPVIEIINENARSDNTRPFLPYGNPLAGNSMQNAKLHAQNQQAMFNAERIRQHRAQIQRWNEVPKKDDSYVRAYHDLQETQQLELEKEQSTIQERKLISPVPPPPVQQEIPTQKDTDTEKRNTDRRIKKQRNQRSREAMEERKLTSITPPPIQQKSRGKSTGAALTGQENVNHRQSRKNTQFAKENLKDKKGPEVTKVTADDAVVNRNHRSHGSLEYYKYFPQNYGTVQIAPAPAYDQGVYIKPRGNAGFANTYEREIGKLFTNAISSKTQYVYPKQYGQEYTQYANGNEYNQYLTTQNIDALQTLLHKRPQEQANELNALVENQSTESQEIVNRPIEYHYVQTHQPRHQYQQANALNYANIHQNYHLQGTSGEVRDHTPVNEAINDVPPTPAQSVPLVHPTVATQPQYVPQPTIANQYGQTQPHLNIPTTEVTVEQHNVKYYGDVSTEQPHEQGGYKQEYKPQINHQAIVHLLDHNNFGSENYYHHNNQPVQHLSQDGVGVSAYGDDDIHYAANYEFGYRVRDVHGGSDFGHYENKKGKKTDGHYHVLLPDGRMQTVKYTAGPEGFHADISYDHLQ